ncbi:MAG: aldo/keto reductase [Candidatus Bipolaricaulota bacterium]
MIFVTSHGVSVPALGFGTFRMKGDECARAVANAIRAGFRHLDTAEIYENEAAVADGIAAAGVPRKDLFITTKAWMDDMSPAGLRKSLDASLKALRTEYVDLWLIHWLNPKFKVEDTLAHMQKEVDAGRVRSLGVSNFPVAEFERAAKAAPVLCNQVEYHPYLAQDKVIAAARKHDAFVMAYAPLGIGKVHDDPVLTSIGAKYGKSAAQVTLRWFLQQPGVGAIPKSSSREHSEKNFAIFDFSLSAEDMKSIHALARGERMIQPDFEPTWDD